MAPQDRSDNQDQRHQTGEADVEPDERQSFMRIVALSDPSRLEQLYAAFEPRPDWSFARRPETGLVMVQGRVGGGGAPFNLGEMSVSRAVVTLDGGATGYAYIKGRNHRHAAIAAFFDAAFQTPQLRPRLERDVRDPLASELAQSDDEARRQAAATKVDFFTMARGDAQ